MNKKIRLKDIAKMANVSVGTVDRVIHNRGEVAAESYNRVMAILEKTGYQPNLLARTLGSHKTFKIAVLIPNPQQDEYWSLSADGIKQAADEWSQYGVQVQPFHFDLYDKNSFQDSGAKALQTQPDGILIPPIFHQDSLQLVKACKAQNVPFVLFNNNLPESGALSFIGQDLYQSGRVGAGLLHGNMKRPGVFAILHVYDDVHNSVHLSEKEKGFKEYFEEEAGKDVTVKSIDLNYMHEPTIEKELNELLADPQLNGLLVTTSKGAFIVSKLLARHGKNGIRLVAYDLLEENVRFLNSGIIDFLINQNSKRQAFIGISQLANHLLFKKKAVENFLFPLEIITKQNLKSYLNSGLH
jgi:LacI family transcriptional regulator